jgi:hypothetical protein
VKFPQSALKTALVLAVTNAALVLHGADFQYTFTGSEFTGALNGVPFAAATVTVTGIADPSGAVFSTTLGVPTYLLPVTPLIVIEDGVNTYSATLLNSPGLNWAVVSFEFAVGVQGVGFALYDDLVAPTILAGMGTYVPGSPYDFSSPILLVSSFVEADQGPFSTSVGDLVLPGLKSVAGSFEATAVPEVSTFVPVGFALVGGGILVARRRQTQVL